MAGRVASPRRIRIKGKLYWNAKEAAEYLGVTDRTVRMWATSFRSFLQPVRVSGVWYYPVANVRRFKRVVEWKGKSVSR